LGEAEPLPIPLREGAYRLVAVLVEAEPIHDLVHAQRELAVGDAAQHRESRERLGQPPAAVDIHQLGEVADAEPLDVGARREAANANRALGRQQVAEKERDERALTSAVRGGDSSTSPAGTRIVSCSMARPSRPVRER
jgi:hypothetical protein